MTRMMTTGEAADYCRLSVDFLNKARCFQTDGPAYVRLGRSIRYSIDDLNSWLARNRRDCTSPDHAERPVP